MRYHVMASSQTGVMGLKRDTLEGAIKKAGELRGEGIYSEVRIIDTTSGEPVEERAPVVNH